VLNFIPYGKQHITDDDINAVIKILKSDFLTQGPAIELFEEKVKEYTGSKYGIAVSNATAALHISCLSMGLTKGDELWTSPISFVASSNCALYCGAKVDFVDIDPKTYNLCPNKLEHKIKSTGRVPKIVVPVHLSGHSCDMEALFHLSQKYGFLLLEDASHAIGASYKNQKIGGCQYSDATVFSFHPVKIITTGEGGFVTTNNKELYNKLKLFRNHGITRGKKDMTQYDGPWYYEQLKLGYNYRITDIQCALGYSQMQRLDEYIQLRRKLAKHYNKVLSKLEITLPYQAQYQDSSWHLYIIKVKNRAKIFDLLRNNQIGVNVHYIPIHTQPYYKQLGFKKGDFPCAEQYYEEAISLPMYPGLKEEEFNYIYEKLKSVIPVISAQETTFI